VISQPFDQSAIHRGGGQFILQSLNHLVNHLLYQIVDIETNSGSYRFNLTQSFFRLRRYIVLCLKRVSVNPSLHIPRNIPRNLHNICDGNYLPPMLLFPQVDTRGTNCIFVTLNSAHAMKVSVALPSRNYRPLYAALVMSSGVNYHNDLVGLFVILHGPLSLFCNYQVPRRGKKKQKVCPV
jgi:hypothetical protein